MSAFGTPNSAEPSFAQCRGPREVGYGLTFGQALGSPEPVDLEYAKMVVLIGSHLGENVFTSQITAFAAGAPRGAKVIAVDPRFSTAAAKADWWLPIRPGTDIALLLAWMHVLIGEKPLRPRLHRPVRRRLRPARGARAAFTPEWAEPITEIPAAQIRETARAMGAAKPAVVVHPGRHVTWYGDDTQRARAMAILTALLGSWGRKGGIFLPTAVPRGSFDLPSFPTRRGAAPTVPAHGSRWRPKRWASPTGSSTPRCPAIRTRSRRGSCTARTCSRASRSAQRTLKAIQALDLLVVVDVMPVEQINYADLVLPEATYLERYDPPVVVTTAKTPFVSIRQPVCEPLHESKPGWWIAKQLATRLGLEAWFPWTTPDEHLATIVEPMAINLRELRVAARWRFPGRPYVEDRTEDDGVIQTSSGKIELFSQELADLGADPLPRYTPTWTPPAGFLRLIYGRAPVHSFARSQNNEALHALMAENEVWLHTASAVGLRPVATETASRSRTRTAAKSLPVLVKVTEGIRRDCAYLVHGFGQGGRLLRRASGRGASDTGLMTRVKLDPLTGGTGMRVNFVRPVKARSGN